MRISTENPDFDHFECPAQSPDIHIIEPLWSTFEAGIRNVFPPPLSLKELEKTLIDEWYKTPLDVIHTLYRFIPRRIEAVEEADEGPTLPYTQSNYCLLIRTKAKPIDPQRYQESGSG